MTASASGQSGRLGVARERDPALPLEGSRGQVRDRGRALAGSRTRPRGAAGEGGPSERRGGEEEAPVALDRRRGSGGDRVVALLWTSGVFSQSVTVPDVTGMTVSEASTALTDAGLRLGTVTYKSSPGRRRGTILSQAPRPGASVDKGSSVDLVAAGVATKAVPNVLGLTQQQASAAITDAGFAMGAIAAVYDASAPVGTGRRPGPRGRHAASTRLAGRHHRLEGAGPERESAGERRSQRRRPDTGAGGERAPGGRLHRRSSRRSR